MSEHGNRNKKTQTKLTANRFVWPNLKIQIDWGISLGMKLAKNAKYEVKTTYLSCLTSARRVENVCMSMTSNERRRSNCGASF
jgi:hypothetical protein